MKIEYIKKLLKTDSYDFLRVNKYLGSNLLLLCLSGSHSYGTNVETSDVDIRGVTLEPIDCLLGFDDFEQFEDKETDTVIYSLSKFMSLAYSCNPTIIELLFLEEEQYLYVSPLGQLLIDNRDMFLSKRAIYTFGGYANAQLNRLENAMARNGEIYGEKEKKEHVTRSLINVSEAFLAKNKIEGGYIKPYVFEDKDGYHINLDIKLSNIKATVLKSYTDEMSNLFRAYDEKKEGKNKRKDDLHLNKHMMHLIRLYLEGIELLAQGSFHTYRENDKKLLLDIRNGKYRNEDGTLKPEFIVLLRNLENKFQHACETTCLPDKPNYEKGKETALIIYKNRLKEDDD